MHGEIRKPERIEEAIKELYRAAGLLQAVLDGQYSLRKAAAWLHVEPQELNRCLAKKFQPWIKSRILELPELQGLIENLRTPADRLIMDILRLDNVMDDHNTVVLLPFYDQDQFWQTVKKILSDREYDILARYFGYQCPSQSLPEIAKVYCLAKSRIYQIYCRAEAKLWRSELLKQVFTDDETGAKCLTPLSTPQAADTENADHLTLQELWGCGYLPTRAYFSCRKAGCDTLEDVLRVGPKKIQDLTKDGLCTIEEIQDCIRRVTGEKTSETEDQRPEAPGSSDNEQSQQQTGQITGKTTLRQLWSSGWLSARAFHACDRSGYRTVKDLMSATPREISNMRNVGVKTANEIQTLIEMLQNPEESKGDE